MQSKRVRLVVQYSVGERGENNGYDKSFARVKRLLNEGHPDVIIEESKIVRDDDTFKILVDGKLVYEKPRDGPIKRGVFLSMRNLEKEIMRARRQRRPTTTYAPSTSMSPEEEVEIVDEERVKKAADLAKYD